MTSFVAAAAMLVATAMCFAQHTDAFISPSAQATSVTLRGAGRAFLLTPADDVLSPRALPTVMLNMAGQGGKKKRRRRKDASAGRAPSGGAESPAADDGELPDFDLDDEAEAPAAAISSSSSPSPSSSLPPPTEATPTSNADMSDPKVLEAMKGSKASRIPSSSTEDLLRDRELEKSFTFDDSATKEDLPSLGQIASKTRSGGADGGGSFVIEKKMGKKRARAEARRAAAVEAEEAARDEGGVLKSLPFLLGEDGEVSITKVLEAGAWLGIALLILWEAYLNSPFFERAAPMAPVVYQFLL